MTYASVFPISLSTGSLVWMVGDEPSFLVSSSSSSSSSTSSAHDFLLSEVVSEVGAEDFGLKSSIVELQPLGVIDSMGTFYSSGAVYFT